MQSYNPNLLLCMMTVVIITFVSVLRHLSESEENEGFVLLLTELSPLELSALLNSLPCSLSFHRDTDFKFKSLLKEVVNQLLKHKLNIKDSPVIHAFVVNSFISGSTSQFWSQKVFHFHLDMSTHAYYLDVLVSMFTPTSSPNRTAFTLVILHHCTPLKYIFNWIQMFERTNVYDDGKK